MERQRCVIPKSRIWCSALAEHRAMGPRGRTWGVSRQQCFIVAGNSCAFCSHHYSVTWERPSKAALLQAVVGFPIFTTDQNWTSTHFPSLVRRWGQAQTGYLGFLHLLLPSPGNQKAELTHSFQAATPLTAPQTCINKSYCSPEYSNKKSTFQVIYLEWTY